MKPLKLKILVSYCLNTLLLSLIFGAFVAKASAEAKKVNPEQNKVQLTYLNVDGNDINTAIADLSNAYKNRGLSLNKFVVLRYEQTETGEQAVGIAEISSILDQVNAAETGLIKSKPIPQTQFKYCYEIIKIKKQLEVFNKERSVHIIASYDPINGMQCSNY